MPLLGFVEIRFLFVAGSDSDLGLAEEPSLLKWRSAWSSCWLSCVVSCFVPVPDGSAGRFRAATGTSVNCKFDGATTLMATSAVCWSSWVLFYFFCLLRCGINGSVPLNPVMQMLLVELYKPVGKEKSALGFVHQCTGDRGTASQPGTIYLSANGKWPASDWSSPSFLRSTAHLAKVSLSPRMSSFSLQNDRQVLTNCWFQ